MSRVGVLLNVSSSCRFCTLSICICAPSPLLAASLIFALIFASVNICSYPLAITLALAGVHPNRRHILQYYITSMIHCHYILIIIQRRLPETFWSPGDITTGLVWHIHCPAAQMNNDTKSAEYGSGNLGYPGLLLPINLVLRAAPHLHQQGPLSLHTVFRATFLRPYSSQNDSAVAWSAARTP